MTSAQRALGNSGIFVSPIAMGCWPIAGMTSLNVTEENSLATLAAAFQCGINFFDTAYCYGAHGESEKLIARALGSKRDQIVIATKGGIEWGPDGKQVQDGRPETLRRHCDESLRRLATDRVELLYLHSPDPQTPVCESAGELKRLMDEGKTRTVGASNVNVAQLKEFMAECPVTAVQPHYNLLQREIDEELLPFCREQGIAVCIYWPLMKGFLAGKLPRDYKFAPGDGRAKYPMFQGEEWTKNHDFLDALRAIAADVGCALSQLVLAWTIRKPGITSALVGAKRPDQIIENAGALKIELQPRHFAAIDEALKKRGTPVSRRAV